MIIKTHRQYIELTPIHIGVVIGSMLTLHVIDCGFESRWGKTKIINLHVHASIRRNSKDWSTQNQDKVSEWSDMSTRGLLVQAKGIPLGRHYLIECNFFSP